MRSGLGGVRACPGIDWLVLLVLTLAHLAGRGSCAAGSHLGGSGTVGSSAAELGDGTTGAQSLARVGEAMLLNLGPVYAD